MPDRGEFDLRPSNARVYAITSGKGGVGKTSIAVNLSMSLARAGMRVLLVDSDMGLANVDLLTGVSAVHTIEEVLRGEASIFDALVDGPGDLTILPASSGLGYIQDMQNEYTDKFRTELLKLENAFDIIFIDTGAGISAHVVDFVFMASEVLVVLTPEPTAFADAYAMVKVVTHEKPELPVGIIVNMITGDQEGERIFTKFSEIVSRFLGREIYYRGGVLADNAVNEAIRRQVPLATHKPNTVAMQSMRRIARNILGLKTTPKRSVFFRS